MLEIVYDAGRLDDDVLAALADDELVASLLLVHGLHPDDLDERVERALDVVRPYLGVARRRRRAARHRRRRRRCGCGCSAAATGASSSATLQLAVEDGDRGGGAGDRGIDVVDADRSGDRAAHPVALTSRWRRPRSTDA